MVLAEVTDVKTALNSGLRRVALDVLVMWPCDVGYVRQACPSYRILLRHRCVSPIR